MNNLIHVPVWPLVFLNKYLFFSYPPLVAPKEIFFHYGIQIQKLCFHLLILFFWFNKLQIWSMKGAKWSHTKSCRANRASLLTLLFWVVISRMNQPDRFEDGKVFKSHYAKTLWLQQLAVALHWENRALISTLQNPCQEYKCFEESIERNFASEYKKVCNVRFLKGEVYALFGLFSTDWGTECEKASQLL